MKESTTSFWPRGLPAGALLAAVLIIPAFVVMIFDTSNRPARPGAPSRLSMFARPAPLRANSAFFDGRLAVQAVLSQRFAGVPTAESVTTMGARSDLSPAGQPSEMPRSGQLRLRLENLSDQIIEVEIVRVDSALGDFVARPDRLMLAPNQVASVDSAVRGQKITDSAIPVAIALRVDGAVETRNLILNGHTLARAGD